MRMLENLRDKSGATCNESEHALCTRAVWIRCNTHGNHRCAASVGVGVRSVTGEAP
jgi:hypothetical protein